MVKKKAMQGKDEKPIVVFSAVNITEGGPLSILADATNSFCRCLIQHYRLVLLVNNKQRLAEIISSEQIEFNEYTYPKKSWLLRVWFEYVHCWFISRRIKPAVWFSLHDMTPNVACKEQFVYCHNPAPFFKITPTEMLKDKSLFFFKWFYSLFYRINIRKNKAVIVQQQWMREEFKHRYGVTDVIVAYPRLQPVADKKWEIIKPNGKTIFIYPSLPRVFKKFETLLDATEILESQQANFEVVLTFDGTENKYAASLIKKYVHLASVKFIGVQKREDLFNLYGTSTCVVVASGMETWGLPISEAKLYGKPLLVTDLPYARETVGDYDKVCFFKHNDAQQLCRLMKKMVIGDITFEQPYYTPPPVPFAKSWDELFLLIFPIKKLNSEIVPVTGTF